MDSAHKKILVGVDGSEQAFEAVRYAGGMCSRAGVEIVLMNVMSDVPVMFYDLDIIDNYHPKYIALDEWLKCELEGAHRLMTKAVSILAEQGVDRWLITERIVERKQGVASDMAEESQHGYDAVVVGRRGKSKLKDLILGGTARKLLDRLVYVPVWVVGGSPIPGKVLLAIDGSENAMKAVDYVGRMFEGSKPEVTILHVVRFLGLFHDTYLGAFHTEVDQKWLAEVQERMMPVLEKAKDMLTQAGLAPERITINLETGKGSRAGDIVERAYLGNYGTIVVGRRGISKVEQFLMGRVSSKVIQLAKEMAVWVVN